MVRHLGPLPESSSASQPSNGDPRVAQQPWTDLLVALHNEVRRVVQGCERGIAGRTNAKGDDVRLFDLAANAAAVEVLKASPTPLLIDSEEAEPLEVGPGRPVFLLFLDTFDL